MVVEVGVKVMVGVGVKVRVGVRVGLATVQESASGSW